LTLSSDFSQLDEQGFITTTLKSDLATLSVYRNSMGEFFDYDLFIVPFGTFVKPFYKFNWQFLSAAREGFTPLSLFSNGEQGAWYDPRPQYLYQDAAGTTPVTADGDPVGLMLDKSRGLVLGPEKFTGFNGSTGSWVITDGGASATYDGATQGEVFVDNAGLVENTFYRIECTLTDGSISLQLGGVPTNGLNKAIGVTGSVSVVLAAEGTSLDRIRVIAIGNDSATVTNITVKKLPGNHATQSTAAAKPLNRDAAPLQEYDGVDDAMTVTLPAIAAATIARAGTTGAVIQYPVDLSLGDYTINESHSGIIILDRQLTASELASVTNYLNQRAGV